MEGKNEEIIKIKRSLNIIANINVAIWAISIIAMVFLMQNSPNVKMLYPILGGGTVVGIILISKIANIK